MASLVGALLGALAACADEPSRPLPPFDAHVAFTWVSPATLVADFPDQNPRVRCDAQLRLLSTSTLPPVVKSGKFRWARGPDSLVSVDSATFTAAEIAEIYGDSLLSPTGETVQWQFTAEEPFWLEFELTFGSATDSRTKTASAGIRCVPGGNFDLPPAAVRVVSVAHPDTVAKPGDTITVSYEATATAGLHSLALYLDGAYYDYRFNLEGGVTNRTRTAYLVVPPGTPLGKQILIDVVAFDRLGRRSAIRHATGLFVRDRLAPRVLYLYAPDTLVLVGRHAIVAVAASDDHSIRWVHWETTGPAPRRDSVFVPGGGPSGGSGVSFPVAAEWADSDWGFTAWVKDSVGHVSEPMSLAPGTFTFIPLHPVQVSPTISLAGPFNDQVYDAKRNRLYMTWDQPARLGTLDLTTMATPTWVTLPAWAQGIDLAPRGDSLLITQSLSKSLSVFDLVSGTLKSPIPLAVLDTAGGGDPMPIAVRVAANGKALVVLHTATAGGQRIVEVDLPTGQQRLRGDALVGDGDLGRWYRRLGVTPARDRIQFLGNSCWISYESVTDSFGPCRVVPSPVYEIPITTFAPGTDRLMAGRHVRTADMSPVAFVPWVRTAIAPDGEHFFALFNDYLLRIRISDGKIIRGALLPEVGSHIVPLDGESILVVLGYSALKVTLADF